MLRTERSCDNGKHKHQYPDGQRLKMQFEAFCADMGMTMTAAFNIFAKKAVREYRIPFEIGGEIPNAVTRKAIEDAENGIGMSRSFSSVKDLMEDLNADD